MAGTITSVMTKIGRKLRKVTFTCTADAADGSFPSTQTGFDVVGKVLMALTNPGATGPTADYDIAINDEAGCDIMGGELADRSNSVSEQAIPKMGNGYGKRPVDGKLTPAISNNAVNSAVVVIDLYVEVDD